MRSAQARNILQGMRVGDLCFYYHSNCKQVQRFRSATPASTSCPASCKEASVMATPACACLRAALSSAASLRCSREADTALVSSACPQPILNRAAACVQPGIVGIAEVVREAYPDHTAADASSAKYDAKHTADTPKWFMALWEACLSPAWKLVSPRACMQPWLGSVSAAVWLSHAGIGSG